MSSAAHYSVLLNEAVDALLVDPDGVYIDGTFGRGGHSGVILERLSDKGRLIAIDKDPEAEACAKERFSSDSRFEFIRGSFADWFRCAQEKNLAGEISGLLLDLGVSSPQLDQAERGFSFLNDGPLDMRMNPEAGISAAEWIADAEEADIARVFKVYGEERFARRMARAIVEKREEVPITRTAQLAKIVAEANPAWEKGKNPATRAFQGLRIFINNELGDLESALTGIEDGLKSGGRMVVISFHSLEDRMVKNYIRDAERGPKIPRGVPVMADQIKSKLKRVGKVIKAGESELDENVRSRSAVMRVAERVV
ncbi:MAG: 16S rRNA (cytosine(1402)-N(4))-methyltransferase RsmH [Cellvibrionaceae bacterium]